jgi:hypothetical protein
MRVSGSSVSGARNTGVDTGVDASAARTSPISPVTRPNEAALPPISQVVGHNDTTIQNVDDTAGFTDLSTSLYEAAFIPEPMLRLDHEDGLVYTIDTISPSTLYPLFPDVAELFESRVARSQQEPFSRAPRIRGETEDNGVAQRQKRAAHADHTPKTSIPEVHEAADGDGRRKKAKHVVPHGIVTEPNQIRKFACPYFKRNPKKYRKWTSCPGPGWDEVHRVKYGVWPRRANLR